MRQENAGASRNVFGIRTGTLHPDGRMTPWDVRDWSVRVDDPGESYLALGPEQDTGEMKYRVAVMITDLDSGSGQPGYLGEVYVVKHPRQVGPVHLKAAVENCGNGLSRLAGPKRELAEYQALLEYGIAAPVYKCAGFWDKPEGRWTHHDRMFEGSEAPKSAWNWVKERIEEEASQVYGLLGFYLDRPLNGMRATGWDLLAGRLEGRLR